MEKENVEILSRQDLMKMFGKSQVTIWKWVKQGLIREHRLGNSRFYFKHELIEDISKSTGGNDEN